ncbi:MAG: DUF58 domain-containing protein [Gammaproteobacteria bacterium]
MIAANSAFSSQHAQGTPQSPGSATRSAIEAVEVGLKELIGLNSMTHGLSLKNLKVRSVLSGNYLSRVKGRGMEFDEVRLYAPGDDVRCLDWRVTARTGKVHTKLYREERERPIFLVTDYRPAMFFATRGVFKSVLAAKLAALIAWSGNHHADRVGGQIFTERDSLEFKPRRGKPGILHLLKHLADLSSSLRQRAYSSRDDSGADDNTLVHEDSLSAALQRLNHHARPGNLIFLLSDFRGLNPRSESLLHRLTRHCDVVPVLIYDPLERELPDRGNYRITNGLKRITLDFSNEQYRAEYRERFIQKQKKLELLALKQGMKLLECRSNDEPSEILGRLLAARQA